MKSSSSPWRWPPQPGAPSLGRIYKHRPTSPGPRLPYPPTVPSPVAISAKGARVSLIYWTSTSVVFTPKAGPAGMLV